MRAAHPPGQASASNRAHDVRPSLLAWTVATSLLTGPGCARLEPIAVAPTIAADSAAAPPTSTGGQDARGGDGDGDGADAEVTAPAAGPATGLDAPHDDSPRPWPPPREDGAGADRGDDVEGPKRADEGRNGRAGNADGKLAATRPVFIAGAVVGGVGLLTLIGSGIAGGVYKRKLASGYDEGITRDERDALVRGGDASNQVLVAAAVVTAIGVTMASMAMATDWIRCGPMARTMKRRRCAEARTAAR